MNQNTKKYILWGGPLLIALVIVYFIVLNYYEVSSFSLREPLLYEGADEFEIYIKAANIMETGWVTSNDRMGAPFGMDFYDFYSIMFDNFDNLILKILCAITKDVFLASNLMFLFGFFMVCVSAYSVMTYLKCNLIIAGVGSAAFATTPFILSRGIGQFALTTCQFIPLSFLICYWLYTDDEFWKIDKNFFKYKKNWLGILFIILICNNGTSYYAYFTAYFIFITIVSVIIKKKKIINYFMKLLTMGLEFVLCFIINLIPWILYVFQNGINQFGAERWWGEAEIHGLKLSLLFMPQNSHGIQWLQNHMTDYLANSPLTYENSRTYIGILGIIGFFILCAFLFVKKNNNDIMSLLSELLIFGILLGTIGGFSAMIAFWITPMIRAYNRISIFLVFFCIFGLCMVCTMFLNHRKKWLSYVMIVILFLFGIVEQKPSRVYSREVSHENFSNDRNFIQQIEERAGDNAMIFTLPYQAYPEGGERNAMKTYNLASGYILSDNLKWSFGGMKGRDAGNWYKYTASLLDYDDMLNDLYSLGFKGLYIDKRAYSEEEISSLLSELTSLLNEEPMISKNGNLLYYGFENYMGGARNGRCILKFDN